MFIWDPPIRDGWRVQSHLVSLCKPFRRTVFSWRTVNNNRQIFQSKWNSLILHSQSTSSIFVNKHEQWADGNLPLPECCCSQSLALCIEDSGGSSALVFTQSTRARPVITKLWCQIIEASWDLKLRITAYSLFPLWVHEAKSWWVGRQPMHCGNKRCKASSVTYWFPAFPLAFSLSPLAAHL